MALVVKNLPAIAEDLSQGLIPGLGRPPGEGNGNLLQYSGESLIFKKRKEKMSTIKTVLLDRAK